MRHNVRAEYGHDDFSPEEEAELIRHLREEHGADTDPFRVPTLPDLIALHHAQPHPGTVPEPGACGDPECHVLHADPAHPIHPPDYVDSRS